MTLQRRRFCLSVFDHFVGLALKGLTLKELQTIFLYMYYWNEASSINANKLLQLSLLFSIVNFGNTWYQLSKKLLKPKYKATQRMFMDVVFC